MCGICGVVYRDRQRKPVESSLKAMCDTIIHRGPDDEGRVVLGQAGLGMRRLSIIDLDTGHQPLSNENETAWIVFNGEIYNFKDIRRELAAGGHHFRTATDTESIVHGYEMWGAGVCERLNGMFGFALWDRNTETLLMARDRLGIKPLYYYEDDEKLVFGSEIKAILKYPGVHRELDPQALNHFLTFEYIPAPRSIFKHIRKLLPGHWMMWQAGKKTVRSYWTLEPEERPLSEEEAGMQLTSLMRDSVQKRLISDVPLGAFLSGGIDSSIIVSLMAELQDEPVKTFSIGFRESSYNELQYARAVAEKYNTEHHEFMVEADALELTEKLIGHLDEPFGDFSIFPTYLVSRMARDYVTVVLSGDGGDELFAGYDTYLAHRFDRKYYHRLPKLVKRAVLNPLARHLPPTGQKKGFINSYKRFIQGTWLPKSMLHARWMVFLNPEIRAALLSAGLHRELADTDPYDFIHNYSSRFPALHDITRTGYVDVKTYLADDILVKVDRMTMAASLEGRVPFLDHRVVEWAFSLPPHLKMKGFQTKRILKNTFRDSFPDIVRNRDKQGFSIPIKNWIRGELKPMMMDLLNERRLVQQGLFNASFVSELIGEHVSGRENHSHLLWGLMVFQQWFDMYGKAGPDHE